MGHLGFMLDMEHLCAFFMVRNHRPSHQKCGVAQKGIFLHRSLIVIRKEIVPWQKQFLTCKYCEIVFKYMEITLSLFFL